MKVQTRYRVHQHHKFEHCGRKYAADMESDAIVEINEVEWELLNRDLTETLYATVERLKLRFKTEQIFQGVERLERLSQRGQLVSPIEDPVRVASEMPDIKLKLLVPFQFALENNTLDAVTNENRYHLLKTLSKYAELETINTGDEAMPEMLDFVTVRSIKKQEANQNFPLAWYAGNDYDGILLLSQFLWYDILCYSEDVPILYCVESDRNLRDTVLEKTFEHSTAQKPTDLILPKASWLTHWLSEFAVDFAGMHTISEGINVVAEPIGKPLAKQYTAALTEKPLFAKQPIVGLVSGFEPATAVQVISELAMANPHLAFFVYDSLLAARYKNPPSNVVIFSVDDEDTRAVLPIFFQALDVVCFPAVPGTSPSLVLEAMAYGNPAVVISQYGLPPEIEGAGVLVECTPAVGSDLDIPIHQVSKTINRLLKDTKRRGKYEQIAKGFATKYTWEQTAEEIVRLFRQSGPRAKTHRPSSAQTLSPPIFCQHYDPRTGTTYPSAYRREINRFEPLETALAEVLLKSHTPAEVETVFKHFQRSNSCREGTST